MMVRIVEITPDHRITVDALIKEEWAGPVIVSKGRKRFPLSLIVKARKL